MVWVGRHAGGSLKFLGVEIVGWWKSLVDGFFRFFLNRLSDDAMETCTQAECRKGRDGNGLI